MDYKLNTVLDSSDLQNRFIEVVAKDIYFALMENKEALEYAEYIKSELTNPSDYTIEDIYWQIAYFNAERLRINVNEVIKVQLRRTQNDN